MAWTSPVDRATAYDVTAADWNAIQANLRILKTVISDDGAYLQFGTVSSGAFNGTIFRGATNGLSVISVAGSANDFVLATPDGATLLIRIPHATSGVAFGGYLQFDQVSAGATNGTIFRSSLNGLSIVSVAGSACDFAITTPSGSSLVVYVPTGTADLVAMGALSIGTTLGVTGSATIAGNVNIGSSSVTDAVAVPTISSGFGTSPSIVGRVYGFVITTGTGSPSTGVIAFNMTFALAPVVSVTANTNAPINFTVTATGITLTKVSGSWATGTFIHVLVRGY